MEWTQEQLMLFSVQSRIADEIARLQEYLLLMNLLQSKDPDTTEYTGLLEDILKDLTKIVNRAEVNMFE